MNITEKDRKYIWHPFTPQKNMAAPLTIASAKGTLLFDESGRQYIDAISSWWVTLHGHAHPAIAESVYRQALTLEQVIFAGFTHAPAVLLAEQLMEVLPGNFARVFYSDNGSTSTEVALKMAIQYWWNQRHTTSGKLLRNKIFAFKNAYHGDTFGAMSVSDRSVFTLAFHHLLFEVIFLDAPCAATMDATLQLIRDNAPEAAAFIYEPLVQGAGGMKMYDPALMNILLGEMHKAGVICIADEVMTGFGRTGKLFASEYMPEKPDIICLSKGLTGGTMPLGVTACTEKIYEAYVTDDKLKTFFHGHSFTANPLACSAALASLALLKAPSCMQQIAWLQQSNKMFAAELATGPVAEKIKNIRTLGTILAFEITQGRDEYLNNISTVFTEKALQQGVYLRPLGNTVYLMPPYCTTVQEYDRIKQVIVNIVNEIA